MDRSRPFYIAPARSICGLGALVVALPLLAMQSADVAGSGSAELLRYVLAAAAGALGTAFAVGRSAVTRSDFDKLRAELTEAVRTQSPYSAVAGELWHRIKSLEERAEATSVRSHEALNQAHAATGVLAIVQKLMDDVGALRERVAKAEP